MSNRPVSTPLLDKRGRFIEFYDGWIGYRKFAMDMAGFAFSVKHFVEVCVTKGILFSLFNDAIIPTFDYHIKLLKANTYI